MRVKIVISVFILLLGVFSSCNKFLDVKPKTQIDAEVAFNDEQGFMDALTGVYLNLNDNSLYGKELSFGLTEVLAKQHTLFRSTFHEYFEASLYNYTNANVRAKIDAIWLDMYKSIANTNNLIKNLNTVDQRMFRDVHYSIIRGEAYGLRAFMHFDLLRLFAPSPAAQAGLQAQGIPYSENLSADVTPMLSIQKSVEKILSDLSIAESALKSVDPIVPGSTTPTTTAGYLRDRQLKFNYFAVKALQARVYLYAGNKTEALKAANEVINANAFPFTTDVEINGGNRVGINELIFGLYKSDMQEFNNSYFSPVAPELLTKSNDVEYLAVYETTQDIRYALLSALENTSTNIRYSTKLLQATSAFRNYLYKMPVIRITEMHYIAAECLKDTDPVAATEQLNIVRRAKNLLSDLPTTLTPIELQNEIFKEYRKELYCEGQLFYYYKRLNSPNIAYSNVTANESIYILPLPENEVEYGNR